MSIKRKPRIMAPPLSVADAGIFACVGVFGDPQDMLDDSNTKSDKSKRVACLAVDIDSIEERVDGTVTIYPKLSESFDLITSFEPFTDLIVRWAECLKGKVAALKEAVK